MKITRELVENLELPMTNVIRKGYEMVPQTMEELHEQRRRELEAERANTCSHCGSRKSWGGPGGG